MLLHSLSQAPGDYQFQGLSGRTGRHGISTNAQLATIFSRVFFAAAAATATATVTTATDASACFFPTIIFKLQRPHESPRTYVVS